MRSSSAFTSPTALVRFFLTAGVLTAIDLWTKSLAFSKFAVGDGFYALVPGWLQFEAVENHGAVFGWGQGGRMVFIVVSIAAIAFLMFLFATSGRRWVFQILLGFLLAGVLGNLYDRVKFGYVRDMIHALPMWKNFFPYVFNVADSCLCTGVGLMVIYSFVVEQQRKRELAGQESGKSAGKSHG